MYILGGEEQHVIFVTDILKETSGTFIVCTNKARVVWNSFFLPPPLIDVPSAHTHEHREHRHSLENLLLCLRKFGRPEYAI